MHQLFSDKSLQHAVPARAKSAERFLFDSIQMTQDPFSSDKYLLRVPPLGTGDRPVRLVNWLVSVGAKVISGERVAELLVDSVLFHLESDVNGTLAEFLVPTGRQVAEGEPIATLTITAGK